LSQLARFLLVGGSNTAVTLVLFVVLQQWLPAALAYTVVFALGLAYATAMTARVVFGARPEWRTGVCYAAWYLLVYGVGLLVVQLLHSSWQPSALVTSVLTVAVTAPLTFLGGRVLFRPPSTGRATPDAPGTAPACPPAADSLAA